MKSTDSERSAIKTASVIGLGYVGLPTAALLASGGIKTTGVDINVKLISNLRDGNFLAKEPGLAQLLVDARRTGFLDYSLEIFPSDAYIIAVPTPINVDKSPGMDYVLKAVESISKVLQPGQLIVLESTSPPGATRAIAKRVFELRPDLQENSDDHHSIKFAYCPERVLPGNALDEIVNNERLIGGLTAKSAEIAAELYKSFTKGTIVVCSDTEAEMAKLVENSYRDVNIAFANEVSRVATRLGVEADKVISLANRHPRVNILSPGVGVGGHCISVDPWFIVHAAQEESQLIRTAREVNDSQPLHLAKEIVDLVSKNGFDSVYCLGLTYKPDSDDLRESPSLKFAEFLVQFGIEVPLHLIDPVIDDFQIEALREKFHNVSNVKPHFGNRSLVLVLVSHSEFRSWSLDNLSTLAISGTGQTIKLSGNH